MKLFDPIKGIISAVSTSRDVSSDLANAEKIIRELKAPMFVEDLIKLVQKTCSLTNTEIFELIQKADAELKEKDLRSEV